MAAGIKNLGVSAFGARHVIFRAALANVRSSSTMSQSLEKVPDVEIEGHGRFKYVLIDVRDEASKQSKSIVRGFARAQWHMDIFDETSKRLEEHPGLRANCLGGGRIEHDPDEKTLKVYGYSQGYGKADHEVSVGLLKKKYPDYSITCTDEGY